VTDYSDHRLDIYTDGSSYEGPRRGGVAWEFVWTDEDGEEHTRAERTESWRGATNNEMELQAVIEALEQATGRRPPVDPSTYDKIVVNTDSKYVAENYPRMLFRWSKNGWKLAGGGVPENLDQWRRLMTLVRRVARQRKLLEVEWVPRRTGTSGRRVDNLAKQSAKSLAPTRFPLRPRNVTRKQSSNRVQPNCVPMEGQTETIRITGHWVLGRPHRGYRYTYEVVGGPNDQLVDRAISTVPMHRSHTYEVQFNDDQGNPQILDVLGEVEQAPDAS
jgi:ribonuclease HI